MLKKYNVPLIVLVAAGAAILFGIGVHSRELDVRAAVAAWVSTVGALFLQAKRTESRESQRPTLPEIANASAKGDTASSGVLSASGEIAPERDPSGEEYVRLLKRDLLAERAKRGEMIDDAAEAYCELAATDVYERCTKKLILPPRVTE